MRVGSAMARCVGHISSLNVHSEVVDIGFSVPICKRGKNLLDSSLLFWSGKRDSHSHLRCARAFPRILTDIPGPWKGRFEVACAEFLMHRHTKAKGRIPEDSPFCFGLENGFPTQAYSSLTISALCEVFSSKVTPSMRSSCTRLHPNAFDKDTQNPRYKDEPTTDSLSPIVILCNFLHSASPFHPIATSPELGGVGCKAVPVGRSVQPCSRCRQVGSLRTGGKG